VNTQDERSRVVEHQVKKVSKQWIMTYRTTRDDFGFPE
jgi:hypothetical protein